MTLKEEVLNVLGNRPCSISELENEVEAKPKGVIGTVITQLEISGQVYFRNGRYHIKGA
ncbi:MAG: hypothetical protein US94_C0009G0007 [Berkelbacteria bacterium GW2011_GWB1_38_5]|uniref:DprA winged helix domain-containing protein n=2 Tax=Candidatus Berkelbacteria TaxID=1618330 RepID=A0A0G0LG78_9BACT|nr:MAG: hypothetical protein US94_C0009G0007 [Berkelbacteria bacterium GW2011_GWB1_38_5]KKQ90883.1 MAG: hypothetical protein UT15_C0003G0058 [Berkelbacteria bacterium GW2011_GWA1_39_10]